jgi:hypothetical protein
MYSQLPSISGGCFSIRYPRTRTAVVTGTHLSWEIQFNELQQYTSSAKEKFKKDSEKVPASRKIMKMMTMKMIMVMLVVMVICHISSGILDELLKEVFRIVVYVPSFKACISRIRRTCHNNSTAIFCAVKVEICTMRCLWQNRQKVSRVLGK